jgi:translocator protein
MKRILQLVAALAISFSAAAIGSLVSVETIPTWYAELEKPPLNPPNFLFGPVWSVLYVLIGVSLYLYWTAKGDGKWSGYVAFGVQMVLNALWSVVFFGLQMPLLGVWVIALLDIMVIVTIILFYEHSKLAAYLLVPYLLWISFATYLSVSIWLLNS